MRIYGVRGEFSSARERESPFCVSMVIENNIIAWGHWCLLAALDYIVVIFIDTEAVAFECVHILGRGEWK